MPLCRPPIGLSSADGASEYKRHAKQKEYETMADAEYLAWFNEKFDYADTLIWCPAASPDDVLAAYELEANQAQLATIDELVDFRLVVGRLGSGSFVIQPNGCPGDSTLLALAQHGPCLSVQWSDTAPPGIAYLSDRRLVASFDPFEPELDPKPDIDHVESWISATPAGSKIWEEDWALAVLITAEALSSEVIDEEWVHASHFGVLASS